VTEGRTFSAAYAVEDFECPSDGEKHAGASHRLLRVTKGSQQRQDAEYSDDNCECSDRRGLLPCGSAS
jgi:hypothetical protein